jgi:hypothetical protein
MLTGESCSAVRDMKAAAQIVKDLVREAAAASPVDETPSTCSDGGAFEGPPFE